MNASQPDSPSQPFGRLRLVRNADVLRLWLCGFSVAATPPKETTVTTNTFPAPALHTSETHYLIREPARIAYSDTGGPGSLVVCVPGLGDLRTTWRLLVPQLVSAGYRVVTMDLRGHGESGTAFDDFSAAAIGSDILALIQELNAGPAVIIGNSMAGAAGVWAAAEGPDRVRALILVDPFVRDFPVPFFKKALLRLALLRPWGPRTWGSYYKSLYVGSKPEDLSVHTNALIQNLREPGRMEALRAMVWASKGSCEARIPEVKAPVLVLMGTKDPDFPDPAAEALYVAGRLNGLAVLIEGAGHYPHVEQPEEVAQASLRFIAEVKD